MSEKYGPNHEAVQAHLDSIPDLTPKQWSQLRRTIRDMVRDPKRKAGFWGAYDTLEEVVKTDRERSKAAYEARLDAWISVREATIGDHVHEGLTHQMDAEWESAQGVVAAAEALASRDLISKEQFHILTWPMRTLGFQFYEFGPNDDQVHRYLEILLALTAEQWAAAASPKRWSRDAELAWIDASNAALDAGIRRAESSARDKAGYIGWRAGPDADNEKRARAARNAATALVTRHLITRRQFDLLIWPMRAAVFDFDNLVTPPTQRHVKIIDIRSVTKQPRQRTQRSTET